MVFATQMKNKVFYMASKPMTIIAGVPGEKP